MALSGPPGTFPLVEFTTVELLRLRAWVTARLGDGRREREALLAMVDQDPGNIGAWDRLSELALIEGQKRRSRGTASERPSGTPTASGTRNSSSATIAPPTRRSWNAWPGVWGVAWKPADGRSFTGDWPPRSVLPSNRKIHHSTSIQDETLAAALADLSRQSRFPRQTRTAPPSPPAPPAFVDDAAAAGLRFVQNNGHTGKKSPPPPETMCGGVGLLDFDGDGWLDVFVVQGGPFPPSEDPAETATGCSGTVVTAPSRT